MANKASKIGTKRLRNSYITSVISNALTLFLIGVVGLIILNAQKLAVYIQENNVVSVYLKDNVKEVDIIRLQKKLDATEYVKDSRFISKEKAAEILRADLGEDFLDFAGYNPLESSIDLRLYAKYANNDSIAKIEKLIAQNPQVMEIYYKKDLIHKLNENIKSLSLVLLVFSGLMVLIALTLINNTIRLSVYSKRFIINTMHLVGATRGFIRKPFLFRSAVHGVYAAVLAILIIVGGLYMLNKELSGVIGFRDIEILAIIFTFIIFLGIFINWIATYLAVNRFLRMRTDDLFYFH